MKAEKSTLPVSELFEQAMKSYEQALKSGLKLQEESTKYWKSLASQGISPQEWQSRVQTLADKLIPESQKSLDGCLKLIEENNRTSLELLKKAAEVARSSSIQEAQTRVTSYWESSLQALNKAAQGVMEANHNAMQSWMDFLTKETTHAAHKGAAAGARS